MSPHLAGLVGPPFRLLAGVQLRFEEVALPGFGCLLYTLATRGTLGLGCDGLAAGQRQPG